MNIGNLVFDLDGTLYPYSKEIENNVNSKSIDLFCRYLSKSQSEVWQILQEIRAKGFYGTEISEDYGISKSEFIEYVCDVDVSMLQPNQNLADKLSQITIPKFVFTDSTTKHVCDVLSQLQIPCDFFVDIIDGHHTNYRYKYSKDGFEKFFERTQTIPQECVIFEDSYRNIEVAKQLGMQTVLIRSDKNDYPAADFQFANIDDALDRFIK